MRLMRFVMLLLQFADNVVARPVLAHYKLLLTHLIDAAERSKGLVKGLADVVLAVGLMGGSGGSGGGGGGGGAVSSDMQSVRSTQSDRSGALSVPPLLQPAVGSGGGGSVAHVGSFDTKGSIDSGLLPLEVLSPPQVTLGQRSNNQPKASTDGQTGAVEQLAAAAAEGCRGRAWKEGRDALSLSSRRSCRGRPSRRRSRCSRCRSRRTPFPWCFRRRCPCGGPSS